jgi:hypothetical protein
LNVERQNITFAASNAICGLTPVIACHFRSHLTYFELMQKIADGFKFVVGRFWRTD